VKERVVITGLGVVAPNGANVHQFEQSLRNGISGIQKIGVLEDINLTCQIAGIPKYDVERLKEIVPKALLFKLENEAIKYSCLAATEAWEDAGLEYASRHDEPDWDSGLIFGVGTLAMDEFIGKKMDLVDCGNSNKAGTRVIEQSMNSCAATYINEIIGLGNVATANSSACATGTEAIIQGYERIKSGKAKRMLCGSCESQGKYIWGAFDGMRILCSDSNDNPTMGSRPMSADARGFVPGTGAGALVLETLQSALERNAKIYGEIIAGDVNTGGQRNGGSITAGSSVATIRCLKSVIEQSGIAPADIDLISGHLTATMADPIEVENWSEALGLSGVAFPYINAPKSMIGHCIGASGSIESVAAVLQLYKGFIHPTINLKEIHPRITQLVDEKKIPKKLMAFDLNYVIKASFGFGDVNSCIILKKWNENGR
jgi:3-oxoacyl-[acyl-carrier-protein] synthase I